MPIFNGFDSTKDMDKVKDMVFKSKKILDKDGDDLDDGTNK